MTLFERLLSALNAVKSIVNNVLVVVNILSLLLCSWSCALISSMGKYLINESTLIDGNKFAIRSLLRRDSLGVISIFLVYGFTNITKYVYIILS